MKAQAYLDMMKRQQQELTDFPIAYAFNEKQLEEALEKLGATKEECCTYLNMGDVMKKTDVPAFKAMLKRHTEELQNAMKNEQFAEEAFRYEMDNHEYAINWSGDDDGTVKYNDVNRSYCVSIHDSNNTYSSGLVRRIIDEMFPITMPYMPGRPIKVYCEDFLTDKKNGDFDTVGVFYALKTENGKQEKIEINRFFREPEGDEEGSWTEISKEEYYERKDRQINN